MSKSKSKTIGITLGDPGGIGTEVVSKALSGFNIPSHIQIKIIGNKNIYFKNIKFISVNEGLKTSWGKPSLNNGKAALSFLNKAIELIKNKEIDVLVTAPVCKESIIFSNPSFIGHTEYLANAFKSKRVEMMFVAPSIKTIIATRHIPLKNVSQAINARSLFETIHLTNWSLKKIFKIKTPCIAVCGLNPHAGEAGTMGWEEKIKIIPAINKARAQKIKISGPYSADTLFIPQHCAQFDAVIAMYHDQGLGPIKAMYFDRLVNLTIGLPFIRTSPAHGTAFDIAGKNKANPSSMAEAIKLAIEL